MLLFYYKDILEKLRFEGIDNRLHDFNILKNEEHMQLKCLTI